MYQNYDNAVGKVNKYLTENQLSSSVIYKHSNCYCTFKDYLEEKQLHYSHEEAVKWLNNNKPKWQHSKFKAFRLSLFRLNDVMKNDFITTDSYVYENSSNYKRLPDWSRLLLDGYLNDLSESFLDSSINQYRIACSEFLIYIKNIDGKSTKDINHKNLIGYYNQNRRSTVTKNQHNGRIRNFLYYLADKKTIPASLPYVLNPFIIPRIIIIDEPSDPDKKACFHNLDQISDKIPAIEYYSIAKELGDTYLNRHNYSKPVKSVFRQTWRELYVFLEANGLRYSNKIAEYWCICQKSYTCQWRSYRRAIKFFEQYRTFGDIKPNIVYSYKKDPVSELPEWSRFLLLDFLSKKQKEENAVSTVAMYRSSCLRFLKFLDKEGIKSCAMITPEIIKEFHISDPHSTAESKNAYSVRIRGFLNYLADLGYVPETLHLALTTECAQRTKIIEILTNEEIASIYSYRTNAVNPMELRNSAIVLIGLRMGMRASDIVDMKMTDISWEKRTISVQQQKTNRFLKLPMPLDVGNSLYRYIMNGRPCMTTDYVFINHRVPYDKLNARCCQRALKKVLGKQKYGFHVTRRTFASRMLMNRTDTDTIADLLGHINSETVLKYLATDSDTMRQCALSLKGIELKGGMMS